MRLICISILTVLSTACATSFDAVVGAQIADTYRLPADYAEHRVQQQFFESPDGRIAFTDHGTGPALVLLHGVPTSSWMYRKVIPDLQAHARVISVDLLGYGSSDKPDDDGTVYTPTAQAQRIASLLDSLSVQSYGIVMHDMGGLVAWEMLRADPTAIQQLVVLNTIVQQDGFDHPDFKPGVFTRQMTRAMAGDLTSATALRLTFRSLGLTGDAALTEAECFGYVQPMREGADPALYAFYSSLDQALYDRLDDNRALFQRYSGKSLVLWGERDEILTTAQLPFLIEHLRTPPANVHVYPEQQHFLAEEIPAELVQQIAVLLQN
ncbi:MAG: alpha/beta fold hydrolase [Pseudomonadota bacterium]